MPKIFFAELYHRWYEYTNTSEIRTYVRTLEYMNFPFDFITRIYIQISDLDDGVILSMHNLLMMSLNSFAEWC